MAEGKKEYTWLSVRLERSLAEQVAQLARAQERKKGELIRLLLRQALAAEEQGHVNVSRAQAAYRREVQSQEGKNADSNRS